MLSTAPKEKKQKRVDALAKSNDQPRPIGKIFGTEGWWVRLPDSSATSEKERRGLRSGKGGVEVFFHTAW